MAGWRSHEEIIAWQLSTDLKNRVYALIEADRRIQKDERFRDHLDGAVSSAPRLIAEGFGRYLPGDFSGYLRKARASKAATGLIAYLKTAKPPNEEPRRRRTWEPRTREPRNPERKPPEPPEPLEPMEPMD
jgi:four helix bundle protein